MGNIDIFIYNIYKYFLNKRRFWGRHKAVLGSSQGSFGVHEAVWGELSTA